MKKESKVRTQYVDGFLLPVPAKNLSAYRRISQKAGKIWIEYGALEYRECVGDDLQTKMGKSFPKLITLKSNETVFFSWITYKSRTHRDKVNSQVMSDPRLKDMMDDKKMPFDVKRMSMGGFKIIVDL